MVERRGCRVRVCTGRGRQAGTKVDVAAGTRLKQALVQKLGVFALVTAGANGDAGAGHGDHAPAGEVEDGLAPVVERGVFDIQPPVCPLRPDEAGVDERALPDDAGAADGVLRAVRDGVGADVGVVVLHAFDGRVVRDNGRFLLVEDDFAGSVDAGACAGGFMVGEPQVG